MNVPEKFNVQRDPQVGASFLLSGRRLAWAKHTLGAALPCSFYFNSTFEDEKFS